MSSIRKQIIAAIETRLADIQTANGYNTNIGSNIFRGIKIIDFSDECPATALFPQPDELSEDEYDQNKLIMPVAVQGLVEIGSSNPSDLAENMLADLIECLTGGEWSMSYTSGSSEIEVGDTVTGATSGATAYVAGITLATGSWAGGDAAGTLTLRRLSGEFHAEEINTNAATIDGTITYSSEIDNATGGLADRIYYQSGGPTDYPESGQLAVGVEAIFNIDYYTSHGDPYSQ